MRKTDFLVKDNNPGGEKRGTHWKMNNETALYGRKVRHLIETYLCDGSRKGLVVLRHSVRHYDTDNPINEPFMGLTEEGKQASYAWGKALPPVKELRFFSSFIGRCIETAYLIDKGFVAAGGVTRHNKIESTLSPFYIRDALGLFENYLKGSDFLPAWFNRAVPPKIIDPPEQVAAAMIAFWKKRLMDEASPARLDVCVTHDWNLYALRWHLLGIFPDHREKVDYLDGLVVFRDGNSDYAVSPGHEPRRLE